MRFKNRYLIVRVHTTNLQELVPVSLERLLRKKCLEMFGSIGGANMVQSLGIKYSNNSVLVVRCGRADVVKVRAMLTFMSAVENQPCCMEVVGVSGSVRTCRAAVANVQRQWHSSVDEATMSQDQQKILNIVH